MELGAPDSSGRRRPVPVEGSDYELNVDYILAAIGQKTNVNFLEDVNASSSGNQLKVNAGATLMPTAPRCKPESLRCLLPAMV